MSSPPISFCGEGKPWLTRLVPALDWLRHYERRHLAGDALAGVIVATLLIPPAMATALLVGGMQIAMGAARLGVLTHFLSQSVLSGFTSAAVCHIALSQVKHLIGVSLAPSTHDNAP